MDTVGQGYISFEQWLEFTYDHVLQQVRDCPAHSLLWSPHGMFMEADQDRDGRVILIGCDQMVEQDGAYP